MAGTSSVTGDQTIFSVDNITFSQASRSGAMTTNGQLWIGSTASNLPNNGGHVRLGQITSTGGTLAITYAAPNINIETVGGASVLTLTGNTGGAIAPVAGNINTLGTGSITIAGSGSTLTTQLTGITNHSLQVGAGTATLTQLANGTTGQVLTAVTGADPIWAPPASQFSPNATIQLSDDFTGIQRYGASISSDYDWFCTLSGGSNTWTSTATGGDSGHYGVMANSAFTTNCDLFLNVPTATATTPQLILGGGAITLNWIVKIGALSTGVSRYILRIGFGDTPAADQVNGVYFEYSDNVNSGQWQYKTANASNRTTSNSTIAANTNYHNFQIEINAAGTSCAFSIDGVSLGAAIVATIPTLAITPCIETLRTVGTIAAATVSVDLFYMTQTLTTPR